MKRIVTTMFVGGLVVLSAAGCNHSGKVKAGLSSAAANPAASIAQATIQTCVQQNSTSVKAIEKCIFPAGTTVKVKSCILAKGAADMSAGKAKVEQDIADCIANG